MRWLCLGICECSAIQSGKDWVAINKGFERVKVTEWKFGAAINGGGGGLENVTVNVYSRWIDIDGDG